MRKFWYTAVAVCGLGAVGTFVFWSLYYEWLRLPIFTPLTSEQTFIVMIIFLVLTFCAVIAMLGVGVYVTPSRGISTDEYTQLAKELGVTQAALHKFFEILTQEHVPPADLDATLRNIATRHKLLLERVRTLSADDPQIAQLREAATTAINQGHYDQVEALLNEASTQDLAAAEALRDVMIIRRLSAAEAKAANGDLKMTQLAYSNAAAYYRQAAMLIEPLPAGHEASRARHLHDWGLASYSARDYVGSAAPFQQALSLYRQLAEHNPAANVADVATTLNSLGNLYSDTQRLQEAEQAYQEALRILRQLAQANPQTYVPDVATTLDNLGLLKFLQSDLQETQILVEEALTIRRSLWKQHAVAYGDALARSLQIDIMLLQHQGGQGTLICDRLHEMANVALQEHLKQWAQERLDKMCPSGQ